jgi:lipid II:glycine glycyltransferase (peptidoglycan interpeptide bridge formation enzyme)
LIRHREQGKASAELSRRKIELLWKHVVRPGRARAYFALKAEAAVSAVVVGTCGPRGYLLYSGSTSDGLNTHASKGLLWHAIQTEYERGIREFNLGGMAEIAAREDSVDHGLYRFKRGFGGEERICTGGYKVLRPATARIYSFANQAHRYLGSRTWVPREL